MLAPDERRTGYKSGKQGRRGAGVKPTSEQRGAIQRRRASERHDQ